MGSTSVVSHAASTISEFETMPIRPAPDLWSQALSRLNEQDRLGLSFDQTDQRLVLAELSNIVEAKQKRCLERRWKFTNSKGQQIVVRDLFEKIANYIEKFTKVIDTAVQHDPVHAALPWAAVRVLLQTAVNDTQMYGSMVQGVETVSNLVTRYAIVEKMYLGQTTTLRSQLKSELLKLYLAVLQYLVQANRYYGHRTAVRIVQSIVRTAEKDVSPGLDAIVQADQGLQNLLRLIENEDRQDHHMSLNAVSDQVQNIMDGVQRLRDDASMELSSLHDTQTKTHSQIEKSCAQFRQRLSQIQDELQQPLIRMMGYLDRDEDNMTRSDRIDVLRWISKVPHRKIHDNIASDLLPLSGRWLERNSLYQEWRKSSISSTLWLHGIPGSGKSKLVAHVVRQLHHEAGQHQFAAPIAYFYCARATAEPERADPSEIMRSLLKQISNCKPDEPVRKNIRAEYYRRKKEADDDATEMIQLNIGECVAHILEVTNETSATIVVDALDECDPATRHELLRALKEIVTGSASLVKLFISSRDNADITLRLADVPNIYIKASDNGEDIERFTHQEIDKAIQEQRLLSGNVSDDLREQIKLKLIQDAQGMFLWVSLQIQNLCNFQRIKIAEDVIDELRHVPKSLEQLYTLTIDQITSAGTKAFTAAIRALQWILTAQTSLPCEQLALAVGHATGTNLRTDNILDLCNNLIIVDAEMNVFRFAHLSVREFLESKVRFSAETIQPLLASQCLQYCIAHLDDNATSDSAMDAMSYSTYATVYWPAHAHYSAKCMPPELFQRIKSFLYTQGRIASQYYTWIRVISKVKTSAIEDTWKTRLMMSCSRPAHPIFLILAFELHQFLPIVVDSVATSGQIENRFHMTPLAMACTLGITDVVKFLLDHGAQVNVAANISFLGIDARISHNPLGQAITHNHLSVVQLLLEAKADLNPDFATRRFPSPLVLAIRTGNVSLVEALLTAGATVNEYRKDYPGALGKAAELGNEDLCRLLLHWGADPNIFHENEYNPAGALEYASSGGHLPVVRLLIAHGATIDCNRTRNSTALAEAALEGHEEVVEYLLEQGADINSANERHGNAFLAAVYGGSESIVKRMIDHGADINASPAHNGNALGIAALKGHLPVVKLLLENGAESDREFTYNGETRDALQLAALAGNIEILQELLSHNVRTGKESRLGELLVFALLRDQQEIFSWLLEAGADPNTSLLDGTSPLYCAVRRQNLDVVRLLISKGAELDAIHSDDGSLLLVLCSSPMVGFWLRPKETNLDQIFELLVDLGVNINATGGTYGDALQAAAYFGHQKITTRLLELGAVVNIGIGLLGSPFHAAAARGYPAIVRALLSSNIYIDTNCGPFGTALQAAACYGRKPASMLLLEDENSPETRVNYEYDVLRIKPAEYRETFTILLEAGAGAHCRGGHYGGALQAAAYAADEDMVARLLGENPVLSDNSGFYGSCLQAVASGEANDWWCRSYSRSFSESSVVYPEEEEEDVAEPDYHARVLDMLLVAGADVNVTGGFFGTSLQAAAHSDNPTLVLKLLDAGADIVENGSGHYGGCISAAIGFGKRCIRNEWPSHFNNNAEEILSLLLQRLKSENFVETCKRAAQRARQHGNEEGLTLLRKVALAVSTERNLGRDLAVLFDEENDCEPAANETDNLSPCEISGQS